LFFLPKAGDEYFANLIDYEARKVKERRAYEEVKSGRYHHPGFIKRKKNRITLCIDTHSLLYRVVL
jgi:hypothetical protein